MMLLNGFLTADGNNASKCLNAAQLKLVFADNGKSVLYWIYNFRLLFLSVMHLFTLLLRNRNISVNFF